MLTLPPLYNKIANFKNCQQCHKRTHTRIFVYHNGNNHEEENESEIQWNPLEMVVNHFFEMKKCTRCVCGYSPHATWVLRMRKVANIYLWGNLEIIHANCYWHFWRQRAAPSTIHIFAFNGMILHTPLSLFLWFMSAAKISQNQTMRFHLHFRRKVT